MKLQICECERNAVKSLDEIYQAIFVNDWWNRLKSTQEENKKKKLTVNHLASVCLPATYQFIRIWILSEGVPYKKGVELPGKTNQITGILIAKI